MRAYDFLTEANIAAKITQDPKLSKMLAIAIRHDRTIPRHDLAVLGPNPTIQQYTTLWGNLVDNVLSSTNFGDLSKDGKLDSWIINAYINHFIDFEDLVGESIDLLGGWKALSIRGMLKPEHQNLNQYRSLEDLKRVMDEPAYRDELRRIKNAEMLEKHKRERKEVVLIDNERFLVIMPGNYGACYTFNNQTGHQSHFCTGGSDGLRWFQRYADYGPIISIVDKQNINSKNGKWQFHTPTNQLVNSTQDQRGSLSRADAEFNWRFPGLMKQICTAMLAKKAEIKEASKEIAPPDGYDVEEAVMEIRTKFPTSYAGKKTTKADMERIQFYIDDTEQQQLAQRQTQQAAVQQAPQRDPNRVYNWKLNVGQRTFPGYFMQNARVADVQQMLQQYITRNRIPRGRVWATSDQTDELGNEVIVRV